MKHFFLTLFFGLAVNCLWSQKAADSSLVALQEMEFEKAATWAKDISDTRLKNLLLLKTNFEVNGLDYTLKDVPKKIDSIRYERIQIIEQLLTGDLQTDLKNRVLDSIIYLNYFYGYVQSKKLKDSFLLAQSLRRLTLQTMLRNHKDTLGLRKRLNEYNMYLKSSSDHFWYHYISIGALFNKVNLDLENKLVSDEDFLSYKQLELNHELDELYKWSHQSGMLRAFYFQVLGTDQANRLKDYPASNRSFKAAQEFYNKYETSHSKKRIAGLEYNRGLNLFKNKDYQGALTILLEDLKRKKEGNLLLYHYGYIAKCYKNIGDLENTVFYLRKIDSLKDHINQNKLAATIKQLDLDYNLDELTKRLEKQEKTNEELSGNILTLTPILVSSVLLLCIVYFLYKRYKNKSKVLEVEKSHTLQKLDEIEKAVTTKYIILNDKTKVYTNDLMYIKADDHYLHLYRWEGKTIMVRETIANLRQKLPPNFIQCHRSYIVNKNYVLQGPVKKNIRLQDNTLIPVSRPNIEKFNK